MLNLLQGCYCSTLYFASYGAYHVDARPNRDAQLVHNLIPGYCCRLNMISPMAPPLCATPIYELVIRCTTSRTVALRDIIVVTWRYRSGHACPSLRLDAAALLVQNFIRGVYCKLNMTINMALGPSTNPCTNGMAHRLNIIQ